jgi:signal-transduction protein with cAMP-binding, CBS, and nucleotidyltransferase domain
MSPSAPGRETPSDVAAFLERFPPFCDLERRQVEDLAQRIEMVSYPPGALILMQSGEPSEHLFVVRSGSVDLLDEGRMIDHLGEGEVIGISVLSGLGPALSVLAREATECYLIDADRAREVLGTSAGLAFLGRSFAGWRRRDSAELHPVSGQELETRSPRRSLDRGTSRRLPRPPAASLRRSVRCSKGASIRSTSATSWG